MTDRLDLKVIDYWGPVCDTGRHYPPHPGESCEDIDEWITLRSKILTEFFARSFAQVAGTAFGAAVTDPIPPSERTDLQRALDILAPHLAWDHRYDA